MEYRDWFFLAVLFLMLLLLLIAAVTVKEKEADSSVLFRPFLKAGKLLYRKLRPHMTRSGTVGRDLLLLDPSEGAVGREKAYYVRKLALLLVYITAASALALALSFSEKQSGRIQDGRRIVRNSYGEGDQELTAQVLEQDRELGEVQVHVSARKYSAAQCEKMAGMLKEALPAIILQSNTDAGHVTSDLNLPEKVEGYPFTISWQSSLNSRIDIYGQVRNEDLAPEEQEEVELTARITYEDFSCEFVYAVIVAGRERSEEEDFLFGLEEQAQAADRETAEGETLVLPDEFEGRGIQWTERQDSSAALFFTLILAAGILTYGLSDRQLHQTVEKRNKELLLDYPEFVSKFALYLGAGLSIRNTFYRMAEEYLQKNRKGGERRCIYEEILLLCHEMDSGISEGTAYTHFGARCRIRQYTKFCSLLSQNLKKGNSELIRAFHEEAELAMEERKNLARQLGEEAGIKLLFPMTIMLGIAMVIILVPAFAGFSF